MGKRSGVTPAMLEAHRRAFPNPKPLYAEVTVAIEESRELVVHVPESWLEHLHGLFPQMSDQQIVTEILDEFLTRMGVL